ncbi:MAG: hypothetical protein LDL41_24255 [Coleofasciculus sp. S288]|nr:hypothetical protein [Coleofasciculus sp. S288]
MKQESLLPWFRWLTQWVRRAFLKQRANKQPLTLFERIYSTDELTMLLSVERDAPGAVATWYLLHLENPHHNLVITLDNIAAIRLALRKEQIKDSTMSMLELSLVQETPVIRTHRFSIQWITKLSSDRTILSMIGTWDADLQGNSFDPNANATTILRLVAREALNLPPIPGVPWRLRMTKFPWSESVQSYASAVLGEKHDCHIKKLNLKHLKFKGGHA